MSRSVGTAMAPETISHSSAHGANLRGMTPTATSHLAQGRFGRMFRNLPPATFESNSASSEENLVELAKVMSARTDLPKDGPDDEESGIPALYTYFGQFVDHDITFDPASSLQKQNDPNALIDYRTPALDLDNVYGRGPDDQPYMYTDPPDGSRAKHFLLGKKLENNGYHAYDLPRNSDHPARALIGDPRNDENRIVSQLQGLFLLFHNRFASQNPDMPFEEVQQWVRFHYQYIVVNDFLPRIVSASVLAELKSNGVYDEGKLKFFKWKSEPFMPVEFSVAAYRMGHSMVRAGYRINDQLPMHPIFPERKLGVSLVGFRELDSNAAIDWARFIPIELRKYKGSTEDNSKRLQFSYKIDTSLVHSLSNVVKATSTPPRSLAQRNLMRGLSMGLPSGQAIARAMSVDPLGDDEILIGKNLPSPRGARKSISEISDAFKGNCPLWTYILAEARKCVESVEIPVKENEKKPDQDKIRNQTPKLGPVGGRIVAEVLLGLLLGDGNSYLRMYPRWHPDLGCDYGLKDFVNYAVGR